MNTAREGSTDQVLSMGENKMPTTRLWLEEPCAKITNIVMDRYASAASGKELRG